MPVILDGNVEIAHNIVPPRVGHIASYSVRFVETSAYTDPDDPALTTITARVQALGDGRPLNDTSHDGTPHLWSSLLHADGFSAFWVSLLPPPPEPGPIELRGCLRMDFGAQCPCWVRSRVTRLWTTYARRDQPARTGEPATWEPAWASQGRIELADWPTTVQGWPALPPGATESGRLVELDLDDVPDGVSRRIAR